MYVTLEAESVTGSPSHGISVSRTSAKFSYPKRNVGNLIFFFFTGTCHLSANGIRLVLINGVEFWPLLDLITEHE